MEMGGDDAESEPGQHEADMALADASVETASGTVHVATAVPVRGAGLQVQPPMAITQCQLALPLSRLMAVAAFSLFLPFPKRTGPNVLENDFLPAKPNQNYGYTVMLSHVCRHSHGPVAPTAT